MDNNSANVQSLIKEWEALKNLNDFLVSRVCDRLAAVDSQLKNYIGMMAQTGVPVQECEEFRDKYYQADENNFKALIGNIINGDLPMIRKYIDEIVKQCMAAGFNPGSPNLKTPSQSFSSPKNFTSRTGGPQDYEKQLDALSDLMNFLVNQRDEMLQTIKEYQDCCNGMLQMGVPRQVAEHYVQNFAQKNVQHIRITAAHIQNEDYKQLNGLFQQILTSLTGLGNSYSRTPKSM